MDYSPDKKFWIQQSEAQKILDYLVSKPFNEVFGLVKLIQGLSTRVLTDEQVANGTKDIK